MELRLPGSMSVVLHAEIQHRRRTGLGKEDAENTSEFEIFEPVLVLSRS